MEAFDSVWQANVRGLFQLSQLVAVEMVERGRGAIVHVSSILARLGVVNRCAYGRPFIEIYEDAGRDFYEIPIELHSPAEIHLTSLASGRTFSAGRINTEVLTASFFG